MKKIAIITALLMLAAAAMPTGVFAAKTATTIRGDANANKIITISDATAIQRHCADIKKMTAKKQTLAADIDGNGVININDVTALQRYFAEYENTCNVGETIYYDPYELPFIPG